MNTQLHTQLGAHVSVAGGLFNAFINADAIGAETIQFFGGSPRQWHAILPSPESVKKYQAARVNSKVQSVFLHAAYLVNLGSEKEELRAKSIASLTTHFKIANMLGAEGLIFHMGSNSKRADGLTLTAQAIKTILSEVPGETFLVMENSAGGGSKLCFDGDELGEIYHAVKSPRLKICLDTAHIFAAGVIPDFSEANITFTLNRWDKAFGLKNIVAIHMNDSKTKAHSHSDRHENLGDGYVGLTGLQNFAQQKRIHHARWILEVPGLAGTGPDLENMKRLKKLFGR